MSAGISIRPAPWAVAIRNDHTPSPAIPVRHADADAMPMAVYGKVHGPAEEHQAGSDFQQALVDDEAERDHQRRDDPIETAWPNAIGISESSTMLRLLRCRPSATANSQPMAGLRP